MNNTGPYYRKHRKHQSKKTKTAVIMYTYSEILNLDGLRKFLPPTASAVVLWLTILNFLPHFDTEK
jgi:hypothetical protein